VIEKLLADLSFACQSVEEKKTLLVPVIDGDWWEVTGNPMDHKYATERQEPVDFAVWQAADGTWKMYSCFRKTTAGAKTAKLGFLSLGKDSPHGHPMETHGTRHGCGP